MAKKDKATEEVVILKVRNRRKSINIVWRAGADTVNRDFHDNPLPSFLKAIDGLAAHVCTLCEFPEREVAKIAATGITCVEKGDNTLALIVARKTIKKGKRVINLATPLLAMYEDDENKSADCMEKDEASAIEKVIKEAVKYLGGDRAQGQINFVPEEGEADGKKKEDETLPIPGVGEDGPAS